MANGPLPRLPLFMQRLRDYGWSTASQSIGGNTPQAVGRYLATCNTSEYLAWDALIIQEVPAGRETFMERVNFFHALCSKQHLLEIECMMAYNRPVMVDCDGVLRITQ